MIRYKNKHELIIDSNLNYQIEIIIKKEGKIPRRVDLRLWGMSYLKYFARIPSKISIPKLTFSNFTSVPLFKFWLVLKYSYPFTVPLCLPLFSSSHSIPSHNYKSLPAGLPSWTNGPLNTTLP